MNEATFARPLEMSAERSEAKQTAALVKRSRFTRGATRRFEAKLH
jgi:hypothetical protein